MADFYEITFLTEEERDEALIVLGRYYAYKEEQEKETLNRIEELGKHVKVMKKLEAILEELNK